MPKKDKLIIGSIIIFSFLWKLFVIFTSKITFFSDDAIYAELARFWIEGRYSLVFHPTWPPLYPSVSAIFYLFIRNWENSLRIISALSGSLISIPIFFLTKNLINKKYAYILSLLIVIIPPVTKVSLLPQSDMLATLFIISAITFVFNGIKNTNDKYIILSSVFFGLTYLTRSEGFLFFAVTFAYIFAWTIIQILKKRFKITRLYLLPLYIVTFLLVCSPYIIATKLQTGSWSLSQKASAQIKQGNSFLINKRGTTWIQEVVSVKTPNYKSNYFSGGLEHAMEYSDWFAFWFLQKVGVWKNVYLNLFPIWMLPLIITGALTFIKKKDFWSNGFLIYLLFSIVPITIFATPLADIRYLLWAAILIAILLFKGISVVFGLVKIKKDWMAISVGIIFILISPQLSFIDIFHPISYAASFTKSYYWPEIKIAGQWIKENSDTTEPKIMMRHEAGEFYSDAVTIYIPQDLSIKQLIDYAKKNNVDYIVAWDIELIGDSKISVLLNNDFKNSQLLKVFQTPDQDSKIYIYKLIY